MLVMGIDPGLDTTGYGLIKFDEGSSILVEGGLIKSRATEPMARRVGDIFTGVTEIILEYRPDLIAMEEIYSHYKHPKTAVIMAHARGAILAAADREGVPVHHYAATRIKSAVTGNGRARKEQVQRMVYTLLGLQTSDHPLDTTDALAVALCHINQKLKVMVS